MGNAALVIGYAVMMAGGAVAALASLVGLYYLAGVMGVIVWKRLTLVYHLNVIRYWLPKLEREGKRVFQKAWEGDDHA